MANKLFRSLRAASASARLGVAAARTGRVPAFVAFHGLPEKTSSPVPLKAPVGWERDRNNLVRDWRQVGDSLRDAMKEIEGKRG